MASYGGYETVRELYRSGLASTFSARKPGEAGESRTVKLYQPFLADDAMAERLEAEVASFLDAARTQQKVAASGAGHWSAVHAVGEVSGGAYFVGDYHGRSAQQLIAGRVKLSAAGLYQLVRAVVEGLAELKKTCNRPHGNLKPSNILLTGKSRITQARPLLTDPAGADKLDPQLGDVVDFHALGELIYQLVLHRTGKAMGGWPAPDGPEWQRLGKKGESWRQLCNRLLNPNLAPNLLTFEDLLDDLDKLKASERSPALLIVPAVAVVMLAGAASLVFWPGGEVESGVWDANSAAQWQAVCTDFGTWVEPLLSDREEGRLDAWHKDAFLNKKVMPLLDEVIREANPRIIAGQTWGDVFKLGESPTDQARSPKAIRQARTAAGVYQRLRTALSSNAWPACARLRKDADAFAQRGWAEQAEYLRSIETVIDPNHPAGDVAGRVRAILVVQDDLKHIETCWGELQKKIAVAQAWESEVFKGLPAAQRSRACGLGKLDEYVTGKLRAPPVRPGREGLADLLERLADIWAGSHSLGRLVTYLHSDRVKNLDLSYVRHMSPFALADDGKLTEDILRRGLVKLANGDYDLKPDPRTPRWYGSVDDALANRKGDFRGIDHRVADLLGKKLEPAYVQATKDANASAAGLWQKVSQVEASYKRAKEIRDYSYQNREGVNRLMKDISDGLASLTDAVAVVDRSVKEIEDDIIGDIETYKKRQRARVRISATGMGAIDQKWIEQRDLLLAGNYETAAALKQRIDRLEQFLLKVEGDFPAGVLDGAAGVEQRPWNRDLLARDLAERRRNAVASALSYADWPKVLSGAGDADLQQKMDRLVAHYEKWRSDLALLVPTLNRVQDLLVDGYLLDEDPGDGKPVIAAAWGKVRDNAVLAAPAGVEAVKPIADRVKRLKRIAVLSSAAELAEAALAGKPSSFEAARAAWLQLGGLTPAWPADANDLKREIEIRKSLDTLYGLVGADARKKVLQNELAAESRRRWQACLTAQAEPGKIERIIARMGDFGISADEESLPPLARYRLAMHDFRRRMLQARDDLDDAAVKAGILAFQNRVKALGLGASASADLAGLIKGLDALRQAKQSAIDLTKAGPGGAGWVMAEKTADTVTYSWKGRDQKLTFARVTPAGGEPCFLCTTEVSLGLFIKVVLGTGTWAKMSGALPGEVDEPRGPRGWVRAGGSIRVNPHWYAVIPPTLEGKLYAAGLKVDSPSALHPIQQVPMPAAVYFARLVNCRLPTSAEWRAAREQDKAAASARPQNLRDKTWLAQKTHDEALEDGGDLLDPDLYYPDAGVFWPPSIAASQRKVGRDGEAWPGAGDDGSLWPAKVVSDSRRTFQHLVGNVAEYVYEDSRALTELKSPTVAQVRQLLKTGAANAKVIGGSAMSPPQAAVDKPHALGAAAATSECYSDVGFRLAFLAGRERLQTTLQKLLGARKHEGYLSPERK